MPGLSVYQETKIMNVFERLHSGEAIDIRDADYQREAHGEMDRCRQLCFEINSTEPKDNSAFSG